MICRNCSAEIDASFEKCPYCKKDPRKRGYFGKTGIVLVLVILAVVAAVVYAALNFPRIKNLTLSAASRVAAFQITQRRYSDEDNKSSSAAAAEDGQDAENAGASTEQSSCEPAGSFDLCSAQIKELCVAGADGNTISACGLITAKKQQLKDLTQAQFKSFCLQKITRSRYLWLTIRFEDGTGLVFFGNNTASAVYCKLDENDRIAEILGNVLLSDGGNYVYVDNR